MTNIYTQTQLGRVRHAKTIEILESLTGEAAEWRDAMVNEVVSQMKDLGAKSFGELQALEIIATGLLSGWKPEAMK